MPSPRPWKIDDGRIVDANGEPVDEHMNCGNAMLTVECVNACIGVCNPGLIVPQAINYVADEMQLGKRPEGPDPGSPGELGAASE